MIIRQPLMRRLFAVAFFVVVTFYLIPTVSAQTVLSNFNSTGFDYLFSGFTQTLSPTSVRLTDSNDGWGGGGKSFATLDLSGMADQRLSVDVIRQSGHQTDGFKIELFDTAGNVGKWDFSATDLVTGQATNLLANRTLSSPNSSTGNLNLSQIEKFQVIGDFSSTKPFDLSFDKISIVDQTSSCDPYCGWHPDAAWRDEAATNIDQIRKADLKLTVVDAAGIPVPNATVDVTMQRHEFEFGTAVSGPRVIGSGTANATYRQKLEQMFNAGTLENNLKWPFWVGDRGSQYTQANTQAALSWLDNRDYTLRGHAQVWPGKNYLPEFMVAKIDEYYASGTSASRKIQLANEMRQDVLDHIQEIGTATAGKVNYWDVLNEPRANHVLMDILGPNVIVDWFNAARAADPNAKLFVNEYGILPSYGGTNNTSEQQSLLSTLNLLKNAGAPLDGVGLQAHFSGGNLTGIEQLWNIVDQFDGVVDSVHITEFDIDTTDEALQGAYFRDFLTAMFAHEAVDAFSVWGFWEGAVFVQNRAMFRNDWSAKANGQAWLDLVYGEWWTDETLATDEEGEATLRVFRGEHEIDVNYKGSNITATVSVGTDGLTTQLQLPILVADYNGDGAVNGRDFLEWQRQVGQTGSLSADGNGNGVVDAADLEIWQLSFNAAIFANSTSVPEPSSFVGYLCAAMAWTCRRPDVIRDKGPCEFDTAVQVVDESRSQAWLSGERKPGQWLQAYQITPWICL